MAIDKTMKDKLTDSEKKKIKQENKAKANPKKSEAKKEKNDACREKRRRRALPSRLLNLSKPKTI